MGLTLLQQALMTPGHQTLMTGLPEYIPAGRFFMWNDQKVIEL
ncbi:hypothetical protein ACFLT7_05235 [candidate division KSB1 bacterium]